VKANKNKRNNDHYESSQRQPFTNEPITQAKRPPVPRQRRRVM